ncbi:hypothetical protein CYMTET_47734 [Cymbomonas tetramitiformis]|uniref:Uncharacterized protein n=1 Tax=Cymbomonas tetramitiformis TaxID=36881 RepID=A0AAE0EXF1_9CHLO|nr:hypothetical protein CYMTET_47734 [Cymbomonas tetramitiformis]|eukprot:gene416-772_t
MHADERAETLACIHDWAGDSLARMKRSATKIERSEHRGPVFFEEDRYNPLSTSDSEQTVYDLLRTSQIRKSVYVSMKSVLQSMIRESNLVKYNAQIRYTTTFEQVHLLQRLTMQEVDRAISWTFGDESGTRRAFTAPQLAISYLLCRSGHSFTRTAEVSNMEEIVQGSSTVHDAPEAVSVINRLSNCEDRGTQFRLLCLPPGHGKTNVAINGFLGLLRDRRLKEMKTCHAKSRNGCRTDDSSLMDVTLQTRLARVVIVVVPNNVYGHWHRRIGQECSALPCGNIALYPRAVSRPVNSTDVRALFEACADWDCAPWRKTVMLMNPKQYRQTFLQCKWLHDGRLRYDWVATVLDELSSHVQQMCKCPTPPSLHLWGITATPKELIANINRTATDIYIRKFMQGTLDMDASSRSMRERYGWMSETKARAEVQRLATANMHWLAVSVVPPQMETWIQKLHVGRMPMGIRSFKYTLDSAFSTTFLRSAITDPREIQDASVIQNLATGASETRVLELLRIDIARRACVDRMTSLTTVVGDGNMESQELLLSLMQDYVSVHRETEGAEATRCHRVLTVKNILRWRFVDDPCSAVGLRSLASNLHLAIEGLGSYIEDVEADRRHQDNLYFYMEHMRAYMRRLTRLQKYLPVNNTDRRRSRMRCIDGETDARDAVQALDLICLMCGCVFSFCDVARTTWLVDHCEWEVGRIEDGAFSEDGEWPHLEMRWMRCPGCASKLVLDDSIRPMCDLTALFSVRELLQEALPNGPGQEAVSAKTLIIDAFRSLFVQPSHPDFKMRWLTLNESGHAGLERFYERAPRLSLNQCGTYLALECFLHHAIFYSGVRRILVYYEKTDSLPHLGELVSVLREYIPYEDELSRTAEFSHISGIDDRALTHGMRPGKSYRQTKDDNIAWFLEEKSEVRIMHLLACTGTNEETHGLNLNNADLIVFYGSEGNLVQAVSRGLRMSSKETITKRSSVLKIFHMT